MTLLLEFLKLKPQEAMRALLIAAVEPLDQHMEVEIRVRPQPNNQVVLGPSSRSKRRQRARLQLSKEEEFPSDLILNPHLPQQHRLHLGLDAEAAANQRKRRKRRQRRRRLRRLSERR